MLSKSNPAARPTQLGVRALRADLVYRFALERGDRIASVDDVRDLFPSWEETIFQHAVADNVAAGFTAGTAAGRLVIEDDR